MGRRQGLTDAKLTALPDFETIAAYTALESAVLRYAVAMTETRDGLHTMGLKAIRRDRILNCLPVGYGFESGIPAGVA